jgi:peptidyl-prolyl cis-trans isomerase B (cyclophilin B)
MARTSEPNSAGAQFFFLANDGGTQALASYGTYAVFGQTTEGLDVLQAMAALDDGTEAPAEHLVLERVTINES